MCFKHVTVIEGHCLSGHCEIKVKEHLSTDFTVKTALMDYTSLKRMIPNVVNHVQNVMEVSVEALI